MIVSFYHKGLKELFETGRTAKIDSRMHKRISSRLDALDHAPAPSDMNVPGYDFHSLEGYNPTRYTIHVNGPWCITFEFQGVNAARVDLVQYHR
jgi:toxin HigB-1